jgi:hypothetical protein
MNRKQIEEQKEYYKQFNKTVKKQGLSLNHLDFRRPVITEKPGFWKKVFNTYDFQHPHFVAIVTSDSEKGRLPSGQRHMGYSLKGKINGYRRDYDGLEISIVDMNYENKIADIVHKMEYFLNEHVNILYPGYQGVPPIESQIAIANQHPKNNHEVDYTPETLSQQWKITSPQY